MNPPLNLLATFEASFHRPPQWLLQVPDREMWLAAQPEAQARFTLIAPDLDARTSFDLRSARARRTYLNRPLPAWARYAAAVPLVLFDMGWQVPGFQAVIAGHETLGPRYDYSLGMAVAALGCTFNHAEAQPQSLIDILERAQHAYL